MQDVIAITNAIPTSKKLNLHRRLKAAGFCVVGPTIIHKMPIEANGRIVGHCVFHDVTILTYDWLQKGQAQLTPATRKAAQKIGFRV